MKRNKGKYEAATRNIMKWEWRQKVDNIAIGMIIASVMILAIYFLLVWLMK